MYNSRLEYRCFDLQAAENGNVEEFKKIYIGEPNRLAFKDAKKKTAAHYAADKNHVAILSFIKQINQAGNYYIITFRRRDKFGKPNLLRNIFFCPSNVFEVSKCDLKFTNYEE